MSVHLESLHTTISSASVSNKHFLQQQAPIYQILYQSLIFRPNFCIPCPPCLVHEVVCRHFNINKKRRVCTFFPLVLLLIVLVILKFLHRWKEECSSFFWYQIYIEKHFTPELFTNILTSSPDTPACPIRPGGPDGPCCPCSPGRPSLPPRPFKNQT